MAMVIQTSLIFFSLAAVILRVSTASVPAVFILGDSTADVGTNNFLSTSKAKANFLPYGVDLKPSTPTGRFSNGLNSADFLAMMMGFKRSPPPFLSLTSYSDIRTGTNFASAGSGILETTGSAFGQYVSMGKQLQQFDTVRSKLSEQMGVAATERLLWNSVFLVSTGSNDIFEAYGAANGPLDYKQRTALVATLVNTYGNHFKTLYKLGARKVGVVSIPPIGCCPSQRSLNASGGCLDDLNMASLEFFHTMEATLRDLSYQLPGFKYSLGNTYQMVISFFDNPLPLGFTELKTACCGSGRFNGESPCLPSSTLCPNRDEYLFWDLFHPTQASSRLAAQTLFGASTTFVTPINFSQLVQS